MHKSAWLSIAISLTQRWFLRTMTEQTHPVLISNEYGQALCLSTSADFDLNEAVEDGMFDGRRSKDFDFEGQKLSAGIRS